MSRRGRLWDPSCPNGELRYSAFISCAARQQRAHLGRWEQVTLTSLDSAQAGTAGPGSFSTMPGSVAAGLAQGAEAVVLWPLSPLVFPGGHVHV